MVSKVIRIELSRKGTSQLTSPPRMDPISAILSPSLPDSDSDSASSPCPSRTLHLPPKAPPLYPPPYSTPRVSSSPPTSPNPRRRRRPFEPVLVPLRRLEQQQQRLCPRRFEGWWSMRRLLSWRCRLIRRGWRRDVGRRREWKGRGVVGKEENLEEELEKGELFLASLW